MYVYIHLFSSLHAQNHSLQLRRWWYMVLPRKWFMQLSAFLLHVPLGYCSKTTLTKHYILWMLENVTWFTAVLCRCLPSQKLKRIWVSSLSCGSYRNPLLEF